MQYQLVGNFLFSHTWTPIPFHPVLLLVFCLLCGLLMLTFVCALKYFLNADFSLKIISITPSAGQEAVPRRSPILETWTLFCRLVLSAAASGRQWNGSCCSSVVAFGTSAASRLNATTANRQTWSIIFNGGHKLLMQAHPVPSQPTERMVSRTWSLKATRPNRIINLGKSWSRMSLLE